MFAVFLSHKGLKLSAVFPWKTGIVSFMAYPSMMKGEGDVCGYLRTLAEDSFFEGVEVCNLTDAQWNSVKPLLAEKTVGRGLQPDLLMGKLDINALEEEARQKAVNYVIREVDIAAKRGIQTVALCSGPDPGVDKRGQAKELLIDSLNLICDKAARLNVTILIEPFDRDYDKKLLIGPLDEAVDIVDNVRRRYENIGVLWDLSHAPMLNEAPEVLEKARDFLTHVHIGCAKRVGDKYVDSHPTFYTEGAVNTVNDVKTLLKTLYNIGYRRMVSFEVRPEERQTSEATINCAKGVLVSAYQKMVSEVLSK